MKYFRQTAEAILYFCVCRYDYQTLDYDITLAKIYQPSEVIEAVILIPSPTCWTKKTNKWNFLVYTHFLIGLFVFNGKKNIK